MVCSSKNIIIIVAALNGSTVHYTILTLNNPGKETFQNIWRTGENGVNYHFLLTILFAAQKEKLPVRSNFSFPTVSSKHMYCRHIKTRACLGKG